jgi:uncharacterized protein with HEPN domain
MPPDLPDTIRLRHMLDAARDAMAFAAGRARADLDHERMLTLALVKCIEIIGEAATNVTDETRRQAANVPWLQIVGMRHRLIHAYYDVNLDVVWATVTEDLPPLVAAIEAILSRAAGGG